MAMSKTLRDTTNTKYFRRDVNSTIVAIFLIKQVLDSKLQACVNTIVPLLQKFKPPEKQ